MRRSLEKIGLPNDFRAFQRKRGVNLYLSACDLDTAERVIFGADENSESPSRRPCRPRRRSRSSTSRHVINGIDYVDGGVRNTANIDIAIEKGADLIICYNPFRPFLNRVEEESGESTYFADGRYIADRGLKHILNQVFRTMLHRGSSSHCSVTWRTIASSAISARRAARAGCELLCAQSAGVLATQRGRAARVRSVRDTIERNYDQLAEVFDHYGLEMSRTVAARKRSFWRRSSAMSFSNAPTSSSPSVTP